VMLSNIHTGLLLVLLSLSNCDALKHTYWSAALVLLSLSNCDALKHTYWSAALVLLSLSNCDALKQTYCMHVCIGLLLLLQVPERYRNSFHSCILGSSSE
jgi:hypothetical protein